MNKNVYEIGTRFNDVLTKEVITTWEGENVILNGATGSGKTYFVMNNLYKYASGRFKSILYLSNREALHKQVQAKKDNKQLFNFDIMTYQSLEDKIKSNEYIQPYNYIVCDEWHYVLSDSQFNIYTDLTYDWVVNNSATVIFMSGTGLNIFNKMKQDGVVKEGFEYIIPYDYSYADVVVYGRNKTGNNNASDIIADKLKNTNDKIIYFANNIETAIDVFEQFEDYAVFRCSKYTKDEKAKKLNNLDCIEYYNDELQTFNARLLVTTKCLDNGVDIIDREVKHIICEVFDYESAQQCLGRKRVTDKDDTCTFYIKNYGKQAIGGFETILNEKFKPLDLFVKDREGYYKTKYSQNREKTKYFIYDNKGTTDYNRLAYWKMIVEGVDIDNMKRNGYANNFIEFRLGDTIGKVTDLEELEKYEKKDTLELYLRRNIGRRYYKEDKQELIDKIGLVDSRNNRIIKKATTLSTHIREEFGVSIASGRDKKGKLEDGSDNPNKDKSYWILMEEKPL